MCFLFLFSLTVVIICSFIFDLGLFTSTFLQYINQFKEFRKRFLTTWDVSFSMYINFHERNLILLHLTDFKRLQIGLSFSYHWLELSTSYFPNFEWHSFCRMLSSLKEIIFRIADGMIDSLYVLLLVGGHTRTHTHTHSAGISTTFYQHKHQTPNSDGKFIFCLVLSWDPPLAETWLSDPTLMTDMKAPPSGVWFSVRTG